MVEPPFLLLSNAYCQCEPCACDIVSAGIQMSECQYIFIPETHTTSHSKADVQPSAPPAPFAPCRRQSWLGGAEIGGVKRFITTLELKCKNVFYSNFIPKRLSLRVLVRDDFAILWYKG